MFSFRDSRANPFLSFFSFLIYRLAPPLFPSKLTNKFEKGYAWRRRKQQRRDSGHNTANSSFNDQQPEQRKPDRSNDSYISFAPSGSLSSSLSSLSGRISLRSAVSNTPRSSVAGSNMSARVHRYLIGTPASRREAAAATAAPRSALQPVAAASSLVSSRSSHRTTTSTYSWRLRRQPSIDQSLPDFETQVLCPKCEKWVQSRIRYRTGALTWLVAFIM